MICNMTKRGREVRVVGEKKGHSAKSSLFSQSQGTYICPQLDSPVKSGLPSIISAIMQPQDHQSSRKNNQVNGGPRLANPAQLVEIAIRKRVCPFNVLHFETAD